MASAKQHVFVLYRQSLNMAKECESRLPGLPMSQCMKTQRKSIGILQSETVRCKKPSRMESSLYHNLIGSRKPHMSLTTWRWS